MAGVLIRMKLAILRNSMTGDRAAWMVTGGAVGILAAVFTIWLTFVGLDNPAVRRDLLACVYVVWMLGWLGGPLWGGSAVLRADHFALLPVPRRKLAIGLLSAAFVGVTTAVTVVAFLSMLTYAMHLGVAAVLVAVPAVVLELVFVVLLSRLVHAIFGVVAQSRIGAAITGVLFAAMIVIAQSGWMILLAVRYSDVLTTGFSPTFSAALRAIPSSWGMVAVDAADSGEWLVVVGALAGLVALVALLLLAWATVLGTPRRARTTLRGTAHGTPPAPGVLAGPTGAVFRKELRTWWRDPVRITTATVPIVWALGTVLLPLTFDARILLPWAGPAVALMAIPSACNLYGQDGTALWQTLTTGTQRCDVRGRQWAYLAVFAPATIGLSVGLGLWSGYTWAWPWLAATVPALLGGGAGLIAYASVVGLVPGPDAHRRPENPLERADTNGQSNLVFWLGLIPTVPAVTAVLVGQSLDLPILVWAGGPISLATGLVLGWWLGNAASHQLAARGPELLYVMRIGRKAAPRTVVPSSIVVRNEFSTKDATLRTLYWIVAPLLLFPQGLLPLIFIAVDIEVKSWFLAMYLPQAWGFATAGISILAGVALYIQAGKITSRNRTALERRQADHPAAKTDAASAAKPVEQ